ncbi:MAG: hypothetical protein HY327_04800 [Chloroflexi bacterium]|nr:hypothetical protein [Chloroflexota bacterium]
MAGIYQPWSCGYLVLTNASPLQHIARADASPLSREPARGVPPGALGAIVGNFKSITTRRINTIRKTRGATIWLRNYYEHIVRHERECNRIREYIAENPSRWAYDRDNPNAKTTNDMWLADEELWFSKRNLKTSNE